MELKVTNSNKSNIQKTIIGFMISLISVISVLTISYTVPMIAKNTGTQIVAHAESPKDAFNKLQNSKGGVLGSDVNNKITNLGADIQGLVLSVVMSILTITTLWTSTKFTSAGDNPTAKANLKNALIFQIGGLGFLASYSGLLLFGLNNLNLFG